LSQNTVTNLHRLRRHGNPLKIAKMKVRHIGGLVLLIVMAVATIFLFPVAHGPYAATHGPVTALRAIRLLTLSILSIASAAAILSALLAACTFASVSTEVAGAQVLTPIDSPAPLRC
jgi:hypothetical protein